jgi:2-dehydropantoate 2-reductase
MAMGVRSYAIIGTGALGGYYGARLAHAGLDVHFLLHRDHDHVRRHGLIVRTVAGDGSLGPGQVQAWGRAADMPRCDVVCICLKTTQNAALAGILPQVLADGGVVVTLQNGLGVERAAAAIVGAESVIGGLCFLCSTKVGPGEIEQSDYGRIKFGEYARPGVTDRLRSIAADFARAGIEIDLCEDVMLARWQKLVWNVPFNGLSVVLDATTDRLVADPDIRELAESLMREVQAAAGACGHAIDKPFIEKMLADTVRMTPYRTSMKVDFDAHRPMELDAIYREPIRAATAAGCPVPRMQTLAAALGYLDRARRPLGHGCGPS